MSVRSLGGRDRRGFTLVELMVGMAVGLFVSVIAISLFVSTRKLQAVNSASNRMAENARLAFELLHKDLRLTGFRGCTDQYDRPPLSLLNPGNGGFLTDAAGLRGHRSGGGAGGGGGSGGGSFSPALTPALLAVSSPPLAGSDVVSVRVPVDANSLGLVSSMAATTDAPDVGTSAGTQGSNLIALGDVVMMANCKSAVLFQVMGGGDPAATGILSHAVGTSPAPGNAAANLQTAYNRSDTAVYRMQTHHYYVAPSVARAGTNSLWRLTVPGAPGGEEVVPGIDRLDVRFGVDAGALPDRAANRYVSADNVADWNATLSARIQMLASTTDDGSARAASSVQFAGGTVSINDRRLREVFSEVVSFRNQMP